MSLNLGDLVAPSYNMQNQARIIELATQILQDTSKVNEYLISNGLPPPSFSIDGPTNLTLESPDVNKARLNAMGASMELADLLQGPVACLRPAVNASSLQAIYRWNIPSKVPLDGGDISFGTLAKDCGMYEPTLRRMIRYAILYHRVFQEPRPGFVTHSSASLLLVKDPAMFDMLGLLSEENWQASTRVGSLPLGSPKRLPNLTASTSSNADMRCSSDVRWARTE